MMLHEDDRTLVRIAQHGDRGAFALLLVRHRPMLLALCLRMLSDPMLAEDAVQEASLQALLNLGHLHQPSRFGSWLAGIGLNVCRMWQRSRTHESRIGTPLERTFEHSGHGGTSRAEGAAAVLHLVADGGRQDDPEARMLAADLAASVRAAVATLPLGQRTAIQLFYLSDLSYKETAALLGIAEGTVKTRLYKARGALRGALRTLAEEENLAMGDKHAAAVSAANAEKKPAYHCSFCGKSREQIHRLIAGPGDVYICDECIALCNQIIAEEEAKVAAPPSGEHLTALQQYSSQRWDRFTERARRVLIYAQEEAVRLNQSDIGAEQLLLGLVREPDGVGAQVLMHMGIDLARVSTVVAATVSPGDQPLTAVGARMAVEFAVDEARRMGHHVVGTEHLLLGLLPRAPRMPRTVASEALASLGVSLEQARDVTVHVLSQKAATGHD